MADVNLFRVDFIFELMPLGLEKESIFIPAILQHADLHTSVLDQLIA